MKKEITICDCCGEEINDFDVVYEVDGLDMHYDCSVFYQDTRQRLHKEISEKYDAIVSNQDMIISMLERLDRDKFTLLFGKLGGDLLESTLNKLNR